MRDVKAGFQGCLFAAVAVAVTVAAGSWSAAEALEMEMGKNVTTGRDGKLSIDASVPERTETATFALG